MKTVDYYAGLNYRKLVYRDEEGDYVVEVPDLPGCMADGNSVEEAFANLQEAMRAWIQSRLAAGLEVPEPRPTQEYSGRILVRMPKSLHRTLAQQADTEGISLNQHIVSLLACASARNETLGGRCAVAYASQEVGPVGQFLHWAGSAPCVGIGPLNETVEQTQNWSLPLMRCLSDRWLKILARQDLESEVESFLPRRGQLA